MYKIDICAHLHFYRTDLNSFGEDKILDDAYLDCKVVPVIASDWCDVGLELGIPLDKLKNMKHFSNPTGNKCKEMLKMWISRRLDDPNKSRRPTWRNLINSMEALDMMRGAEELKEELMNMDKFIHAPN